MAPGISCILQQMADDDLVMLDRWRAGDSAAGNALFHRHFEAVYRFFERKTDGDIDDLVQETFLACLHTAPSSSHLASIVSTFS